MQQRLLFLASCIGPPHGHIDVDTTKVYGSGGRYDMATGVRQWCMDTNAEADIATPFLERLSCARCGTPCPCCFATFLHPTLPQFLFWLHSACISLPW